MACMRIFKPFANARRASSRVGGARARPWWHFWRGSDSKEADEEKGHGDASPLEDDLGGYGTFATFDGEPLPANYIGVFDFEETHQDPSETGASPDGSTRGLPPSSLEITISSSWTPNEQPPCHPPSFENDYELIRTFQADNMGSIHLVQNRTRPMKHIIKQVWVDRSAADKKPHEFNMLYKPSMWHHPNIITVQECILDMASRPPIANILMEHCAVGDTAGLIDRLWARQQNVPSMFVLHWTACMIDALAWLHGKEAWHPDKNKIVRANRPWVIVHCDIKPANVFLKWDPDRTNALPTPVLGDFGLAAYKKAGHMGIHGTPCYMAPELRTRKHPCSEASDMYSFGASLYELIFGATYNRYSSITARFRDSPVAGFPALLWLLKKCLAKKPRDRPVACGLHQLSADFKARVQEWHDAGGRVPMDLWGGEEVPSLETPVASSVYSTAVSPPTPEFSARGVPQVSGFRELDYYFAPRMAGSRW